jgi:MerR family mercuric resistance operon transcriptional regulator
MRSADSSKAAAISIGELSRRSGVNIETIRYYERINMMPQLHRQARRCTITHRPRAAIERIPRARTTPLSPLPTAE